jgi:hypothetical protein
VDNTITENTWLRFTIQKNTHNEHKLNIFRVIKASCRESSLYTSLYSPDNTLISRNLLSSSL